MSEPATTPGAPTGKSFAIRTFGCKANWRDGEVLAGEFLARGWSRSDTPSIWIVNSCTVTDEADRDARREARALGRVAQVLVTGCGAEVDPAQFEGIDGVRWIAGNREKSRLVDWLEQPPGDTRPSLLGDTRPYGEMRSAHPIDREWNEPESAVSTYVGGNGRTRVFLKIQEGCDSFCTYCVIPYGRGPSRSLSPGEVLRRARLAEASGSREIILTGTNIGEFGSGASCMSGLIRMILRETRAIRVRLSSLDPLQITRELTDLAGSEERFCPHFHVSLQSPVDEILKRMKRGYRNADAAECLARIATIRRDGEPPYVGMDLITGFPGESDKDSDATRQWLSEMPWDRLHVFPYSERQGTPATRMDGFVRGEVRRSRGEGLRALSFERSLARARRRVERRTIGGVLLESRVRGPDGGLAWAAGYTPGYARVLVRWTSPGKPSNEIIRASLETVWADRAGSDAALVGAIA